MKVSDAINEQIQLMDRDELEEGYTNGIRIMSLMAKAGNLLDDTHQDRLDDDRTRAKANEDRMNGFEAKALVGLARADSGTRQVHRKVLDALVMVAAAARLVLDSKTISDMRPAGLTAEEFIWLETIVCGGL